MSGSEFEFQALTWTAQWDGARIQEQPRTHQQAIVVHIGTEDSAQPQVKDPCVSHRAAEINGETIPYRDSTVNLQNPTDRLLQRVNHPPAQRHPRLRIVFVRAPVPP